MFPIYIYIYTPFCVRAFAHPFEFPCEAAAAVKAAGVFYANGIIIKRYRHINAVVVVWVVYGI